MAEIKSMATNSFQSLLRGDANTLVLEKTLEINACFSYPCEKDNLIYFKTFSICLEEGNQYNKEIQCVGDLSKRGSNYILNIAALEITNNNLAKKLF